MNVLKEKGRFVYEFELPGFDKKDISIEAEGGMLRITAERKERKEEKEKNYFYKEVSRSSYSREVMLPEGADVSKIKASYKNGILRIEVPVKKKTKKEKMKIAVK